ncbi:MAG: hypothetical protein E2576_11100 [Alcaligenaceae bacterium]|nr:hypothetical protein [Alcaligenaceae bacterium SAGV5]MPS51245.1 hypothetical protein [Alcaligenaceae bacterium SAGV3]MPT57258.1 hypothetical protein [Alcaligenaceae bacterium]
MLSDSAIAIVNFAIANVSVQSGMDIHKLRRDNLIAVLEASGTKTIAEFAERYDLDASYLSQLRNTHRNIGEKSARNLELKLGLEPGFLDRATPSGRAVAEQQAVYATPRRTDPWPFHFPFARFDRLRDDQKEAIEAEIRGMVAAFEHENGRRAKNKVSAG